MLGARLVLATAHDLGVDTGALLDELGVSPGTLDDPDGRLPLALHRRLWELASTRSRDPVFGLDCARAATLGVFEALDYALWASADLADVLERITRFHRLIGDDLELEIVQRAGLAHASRVVVQDQRHRAECFLALITLRARELLERPFQLREVHFAHAPPRDAAPHRALFGCPVRFGAARAALLFDAVHLLSPLTSARPGLAAVLDRYLGELVARLPPRSSFLHRVHDAVARSLHGGRPSLAATSRAMHASPRTVQRRLQELRVTHREVVEAVRRDLAERLLETARLSISEIAYLLGYEDPGGFRRAYRRWTGVSPSRRPRPPAGADGPDSWRARRGGEAPGAAPPGR